MIPNKKNQLLILIMFHHSSYQNFQIVWRLFSHLFSMIFDEMKQVYKGFNTCMIKAHQGLKLCQNPFELLKEFGTRFHNFSPRYSLYSSL